MPAAAVALALALLAAAPAGAVSSPATPAAPSGAPAVTPAGTPPRATAPFAVPAPPAEAHAAAGPEGDAGPRREPPAPPPDVRQAPAIPAPRIPVVEVKSGDPAIGILATPASEGVARHLAGRLPAERRDLAALLGADLVAPLEIRFVHGRRELAALAPGRAPGWASGLAYPGLGLVIVDVQAAGRGGDAGQVLRHEIAHVALDRAGGGRIPRWFSEGFAILHSGEWSVSRSTVLARAAGSDSLLPIEDLASSWPASPTDVDLAYAQSVSFVTWLVRQDDGAALRRLVHLLGQGGEFEAAFRTAFGQPLVAEEVDWRRSIQAQWGWLPVLFDQNLVWGAAALLVILGALRAHRRHRRRIAAMEDVEPAEAGPWPPAGTWPAATGPGDDGRAPPDAASAPPADDGPRPLASAPPADDGPRPLTSASASASDATGGSEAGSPAGPGEAAGDEAAPPLRPR